MRYKLHFIKLNTIFALADGTSFIFLCGYMNLLDTGSGLVLSMFLRSTLTETRFFLDNRQRSAKEGKWIDFLSRQCKCDFWRSFLGF